MQGLCYLRACSHTKTWTITWASANYYNKQKAFKHWLLHEAQLTISRRNILFLKKNLVTALQTEGHEDVDRYMMKSHRQAGQFNCILKNSNPQWAVRVNIHHITVTRHWWNIKPHIVHGAQHEGAVPLVKASLGEFQMVSQSKIWS